MEEEVDSKELQEEWRKWVTFPERKIEEVKEKARKAGQDPDWIALGYIIETVIGDDSNAFAPIVLKGFGLEEARRARETIIWRLGWEISRPETLPTIKERLQDVLAKMRESNWQTREGFESVYKFWKENARDWLADFRNSNVQVKKASDDYRRLEGLLREKKEESR